MNLAETIRHRRFVLGISQEQLALTVGVSRQTIHHIERKNTKPRYALVNKIANALSFSLDSIDQ
jgi:DNA-binding XRE family transcriptional regulator